MEKKLMRRFEEMDDSERSKVKEILKDSKSQGEGGKLSWMYKAKPDSEEYLLGRRVDSNVVEPEPDNADSAGALFNEVITRRSELDMQVKMREDPLYAIRKKEEEAKRRLLENPIRMKQLQKVVEEQAKLKTQDKKKKKKKKHRTKSNSDSSDDELLQKYLALVQHKKDSQGAEPRGHGAESEGRGAEPRCHSSQRHAEKDVDIRRRKPSQDMDNRERRRCSRDRDDTRRHRDTADGQDRDRDDTRRHRDTADRQDRDDTRRHRDTADGQDRDRDDTRRHRDTADGQDRDRDDRANRDRDGVDEEGRDNERGHRDKRKRDGDERERNRKDDRDKSPTMAAAPSSPDAEAAAGDNIRHKAKQYGLIMSSRSQHRSETSNIERTNQATSSTTTSKDPEKTASKLAVKRKLTATEMAAKREEMMRAARERDEQREENVKRYRAEDDEERTNVDKQKDKPAGFVKPLMMKHAAEGSVEDRIKRNVYNIQRTNNDLEKHFTKR